MVFPSLWQIFQEVKKMDFEVEFSGCIEGTAWVDEREWQTIARYNSAFYLTGKKRIKEEKEKEPTPTPKE